MNTDLEQKELASGRKDWNAWLVEFFVNNPRLVMLIVAFMVIGGTFSLMSLQRESFPKVSPKMLFVQTVYPGAGSEEVERQVTKPLEDALEGATGIKQITSTSANSFSNIVVEMESNVDVDQETQEIRNKLLLAEAEMPKDAEKPEVSQLKITGSDYIIGLSGLKDLDSTQMKLTDELSQVEGVKSVKPLIDEPKRVVITLSPEKLAGTGIGIEQLVQILKGSNVDMPVARVDIDDKNQTLAVIGALSSVNELRDISVSVNKMTGAPIRLRDIASVELASKDESIRQFGSLGRGKMRIRSGVLLGIDLADGADIIRTSAKIKARLARLRLDGNIPSKARVEFILDGARDTQKQVNEIISGALGNRGNLWILGGIQLVLVAMLLMVNFRAAILAALAIPLSLGSTFIFLQAAGISLNTIVLFSLVLVLGLIVDPAIVILESIQRYRDLGYKPRAAVQATARRYGAGVFMATLTNWLVFLPFGVITGIMGQIIRYIPITVIPALVASYFVPMAILPLMSEKFFKPRRLETHDEVESLWSAARGMAKLVRLMLDHWWLQLGIIALVVALTVASLSLVGSGKVKVVQFSQPDDNPALTATIEFNKGLTKEQRLGAVRRVEKELRDEPGVKSFYYSQQDRDQMLAQISLKEKRSSVDRSKKIVARLSNSLEHEKGFEFRVGEVSYSPPKKDFNVQVQIYANNLDELKKAALNIAAFLQKRPGVTNVDNGVSTGAEPEVRVVLDRGKAERYGLGGFQVSQVLKTLFDETAITKLDEKKHDRTLDVVLKVDGANAPKLSSELADVQIPTLAGQQVRLGDIASIKKTSSLARIERLDGKRFLTVQARVTEKRLAAVQKRLDGYLSPGKLKELKIDSKSNKGQFEDISDSFRDLYIALGLAIFLTYLVLVLQFRSFSQPMIMLFTIPPALIGVFPMLWILKNEFGFLELLGITILVGIVENVAIFLIDYANQRVRQDGMDPKEAIILASGIRFKPIILTKLVALGGLLPLAIESPFWRGLAVTIIAGIGLSGIFSMLIIPILFMLRVRVKTALGLEL